MAITSSSFRLQQNDSLSIALNYQFYPHIYIRPINSFDSGPKSGVSRTNSYMLISSGLWPKKKIREHQIY
ncbi:hypothetical protein DERP_005001 [Dermatophagoides pteronyssinus]|uniref:Uncharacterized protein n=1 Tax=Dermatophagoides pteronyssinus TaxID=6956 RepID=A0ABQ8JT47_DERPT|nr:hypothetical protein DERP_005001 [Dermatophagoides pteronyssinus]